MTQLTPCILNHPFLVGLSPSKNAVNLSHLGHKSNICVTSTPKQKHENSYACLGYNKSPEITTTGQFHEDTSAGATCANVSNFRLRFTMSQRKILSGS